MERGLSRLAELVASVHGAGGGTLGDLHFGLVELAQMAWETLDEGDVIDLFTDVASKAARAARERRLGASSTPIDISAIVRKARLTTLPNMEMSTITRREAAEATRAALGKRNRSEGGEEEGEGGGKRGKNGAWGTGADVLEDLATEHELPRRILDWRQLAKLKSTYTDALQDHINPETGRVHTSYSIAGANTGRLASTDPNL